MKAVRGIVDTLIERRLWPVALLLIAGLVAVPMALSKNPGESRPAPKPSSLAGTPGPVLAPPSANVVAALGTGRGLAVLTSRNPFAQHGVKARAGKASAPTVGKVGPGSATAGSSAGAGSAAGTGGGTATPAPAGGTSVPAGGTSVPGAPPPRYSEVSTDLSFGPIGRLVRYHALPRLSPLPTTGNPQVVFLGIVRGTRTAVFLISSDVHATGDGRCSPSANLCQTIRLREGGTEFFDTHDARGRNRQYELDLNHLTFRTTASKAAAERSYLRVARGAASALKAIGVRRLDVRFDQSIGRLVPAPPPSRGSADAGSGTGTTTTTPATTTPDAGPPPSSIGSLRDHGSPPAGP